MQPIKRLQTEKQQTPKLFIRYQNLPGPLKNYVGASQQKNPVKKEYIWFPQQKLVF